MSAMSVSMAASAAYIPGASLSDKLRLAASKGHVEKVHELINSGATFEPDREGRTALHYAALNGHGEIVQILADEGADINSQDTLGYTALHRAAAQGHLEVIKVLLCEACLVNRQDEVHGNSPLHEAAWNGYSKTLELLVKHKANVHCINKAGFSALHLAAQNGHNQSARVILYAGCNADMRNNYGDTAIHTAARYGHAGVTRILVSARCRISEQNKNGDTSLHISAALKRRKLAKLLTEAGINISLKNKQNETAVDVARRKEHPEIILIITSQPKISKKGKKSKDKSKKDKGSKDKGLDIEEEPEKKGLFFKRKNKNKEKDKEKAISAETMPKTLDHPSAPSEISSSDFNSHMAPEDILRGFRQSQMTSSRPRVPIPVHPAPHDRQPSASHDRQSNVPHDRQSSARGTSTRGPKGGRKSVQGILAEYAPKTGVQYYKDLAGNVKQGPIGYAPVCNCQPIIKKLEKRMENDHNNLYDHIDASHKTLTQRIEVLDKRSAQQVYSIDKLTTERLDAEKRQREDYIHSCIQKERMEMNDNCDHQHKSMKTDLQGYLDHRFTNYERYYSAVQYNNKDPCYWSYGTEQKNERKYHQDDMLNRNCMTYGTDMAPPPGRLYKSKSDETLSVASSHHSRKHWKLRANAMKDPTEHKLDSMMDRVRRMERKMRSKSQGVRAREPSGEHNTKHRDSSVPVHHFSRIPEGQSGSDLHSETYKDYVENEHNWNAKRAPIDPHAMQHFHEPQAEYQSSTLPRLGSSRSHSQPPQQTNRARSASQTSGGDPPNPHAFNGHTEQRQYDGSTREIHNEGGRSRSCSATRASSQDVAQGRHVTGSQHPQDPNAHRHLPQPEVRQSASAYNLNSHTDYHAQNGSRQPNSHLVPHSASYDNNIKNHPQLQQQQYQQQQFHHPQQQQYISSQQQNHRHSQYLPGNPQPNGVDPHQPRAGSEPPKSITYQTQHPQPHPPQTQHASTAIAPSTTTPQRWTPLHASSPDTQVPFCTPESGSSMLSSQNSTPLYPSPSYPHITNNPKSESSSNPDSGYGSRLFGGRQISGPRLPTSTSSSFQSSHEHNSSAGTNHCSQIDRTSPLVQYNREPVSRRSETQQNSQINPPRSSSQSQPLSHIQRQPPQGSQQSSKSNHAPQVVNQWYEQKVKEQQSKQDNNKMSQSTRSNSQSQGQSVQIQAQIHQSQGQSRGIIGKATQV